MSDTIGGVGARRTRQGAPSRMLEGVVLRTPAPGAMVDVELAGQAGGRRTCPYQPSGNQGPQAGDAVLVAESDLGNRWVVAWWPQAAGSGSGSGDLPDDGALVRLGEFDAVSSSLLQFDGIPQDYSHLRVMVVGQSARASVNSTGLRLRMNALATNYMIAYDVFTPAAGNALASGEASWYLGQAPAGNRTDDSYTSSHVIDLPFYSLGNVLKSAHCQWSMVTGPDSGAGVVNGTQYGTVAAITSLQIVDDVAGDLGPRAQATLYAVV